MSMTVAELHAIIDARIALAKSSSGDFGAWLRGAVQSLTVWWSTALGVIIAAWPEIRVLIEEQVLPALSEEAKTRWGRILGVGVAVIGLYLRNRTTQSLTEKGSK